jgi:hypothetical protein
MKCTIFWDRTPCSPLKVNRRFEGTYRLHCQGWGISRARYQCESKWQAGLRPWRWRRYVPPKRRLTFNGLHGVTSQKIVSSAIVLFLCAYIWWTAVTPLSLKILQNVYYHWVCNNIYLYINERNILTVEVFRFPQEFFTTTENAIGWKGNHWSQSQGILLSLQFSLHLLSRWFLARLIPLPWRWRWYVPPKLPLTFNGLTALYPTR